MSDLILSPNNVAKGSGTTSQTYTAGATLVAGQTAYIDSNNRAQAMSAVMTGSLEGLCLNAAVSGQTVTVCSDGPVTVATGGVVAGRPYFVSPTAGAMCIATDLQSGQYTNMVGFGISTTQIRIDKSSAQVANA